MASERNNFANMSEEDKAIIDDWLLSRTPEDMVSMIPQEDIDAIIADYKLMKDEECPELLVLPNFAGIKKRLIKEYLVEFCDGGNTDGFTQEELVVIKKFLDDIVLYTKCFTSTDASR